MLHEVLWQLNGEIAQRCLRHPFVRGLAEGTLDREVFKCYIEQDAFFLRAFLKAYALAAAKSDDLSQARIFHQLMLGVQDELKLHTDYAEKLGIETKDVRPYAATAAYTNFLLRSARHGAWTKSWRQWCRVCVFTPFSEVSWSPPCNLSILTGTGSKPMPATASGHRPQNWSPYWTT